jgi:hypothetical protein
MKTTDFRFALFLSVVVVAPLSAAPVIETATFQNGVAGFTGTLDRKISPTGGADANGIDIDTDTSSYFLDGGGSAFGDTGARQGLLRFDNIVGAGGVPAGAKVISATVDMVTTTANDSQSGGAYNLYQLNTAFDGSSTWATPFGGDGLAGDVGPLLGTFEGMTTQGSAVSARADNAVQSWVDGGTNLGFGIRSDRSTDGWSPNTTGASTVANRPKLTVNYTLDPLVEITSYQNGLNGYTGTRDVRLNPDVDGSTVQDSFIDGFNADPASPDQPYFVRFDELDLNYAETYRAELVLRSGFASANADSPGPFTVHQVLEDWTTSLTYAELDSNGDATLNDLNELMADGMIGPAAASVSGIEDTELVHIDVTSIVENWRSGQPNYGFYIGSVETSNGWQIFTSGADDPSFRPELRIVSVAIPEPATGLMLLSGAFMMAGALWRR